jgi:hypothetical protein
VHLVGFIIRKFVTMQGHVNVKKILNFCTEAVKYNNSDGV